MEMVPLLAGAGRAVETGLLWDSCVGAPLGRCLCRSRAQVHARADLRVWAADAQESLDFEVLPILKGQRYVKASGVCPIQSGKRASFCKSTLTGCESSRGRAGQPTPSHEGKLGSLQVLFRPLARQIHHAQCRAKAKNLQSSSSCCFREVFDKHGRMQFNYNPC